MTHISTPKWVANFVASALEGELMPDGCVRGCPRRQNSDTGHNLRCTEVREALRLMRGLIR